MAAYALNYAGSGAVSEIVADNDAEAMQIALDLIGEGAVASGSWDQAGFNDEDKPMERQLIWTDEETAEADQVGAKAVAELTVVR